jgi:exopolyphosphatase/guanosine-5'-triphosphate,3'-diphosphate pyrophosphatase
MQPSRRAVIDVGTNSVKLLVADVRGQTLQPLLEKSEQTRLGKGFYEDHLLQAAAIEHTARVVSAFTALAHQLEPATVRLIATSAARDARNQDVLIRALNEASGLKVEIISGDQEAEMVFRGVATDPRLDGRRLLILDAGGGSTELVLGQGEHHIVRKSFPIGSVRLLEVLRPRDPPAISDLADCRAWLQHFLAEKITLETAALLDVKNNPETTLVGTGGTATILARMEGRMDRFDRERIEGMRLSRRQILDRMVQLWSLSLAERRKLPGLPSKRADVVLMGVAIYEAVMERFGFEHLYVSTRGLRFGAVLDSMSA